MSSQEQDDEVLEQDPEGRYYRYKESVGKGRFKNVFKAFDTQIGIDVAWSKINANSSLQLSDEQLAAVARDIQKGLTLDHPNIIKCFKCWQSPDLHCINLITELFTSGNLRQYRNLHKHLDLKAVKRMAKQILKGLEYLHSKDPPITHGDLRCDKIYVNGNSGEVKIGDLGLATLLPYRWQEQQQLASGEVVQPPCVNGPGASTFDTASDIFAFGLCMLELLTLKQLDPQHCPDVQQLINEVQDEDCRAFVARCIAPPAQRPSATELLESPFLSVKKVTTPGDADLNASLNASSRSLHDTLDKRRTEDASASEQDTGAPIAVGKLRGEDYNFEFHGKVRDNKMHFRLVMTEAQAAEPQPDAQPFMRTIDFVFDPEEDTAEKLAGEISENFNLSPTDTEICAAALREWLAKEMPGSEGQK